MTAFEWFLVACVVYFPVMYLVSKMPQPDFGQKPEDSDNQ